MTSDGPTPKCADAISKFGAVSMVVHVDGQQPCKQFLTVCATGKELLVLFCFVF